VGSSTDFVVGTPLCIADISRASATLLVVDSGYSVITWRHATTPPVDLGDTREGTAYIPGLRTNETSRVWPGLEDDAIGGRHPNKTVNVGFADGHVSRKKADDLLVEEITSDVYRNRRPLWLPR
jgi:prepilin-type processing-associated H-X9-DG protein